MNTKVVHCKVDQYDLYIGRPSKWGNPFVLGRDGNRAEVIAKYEAWIRQQPHLLSCLYELRDKTLGCYCKPEACHGDVLVKLLEELDNPPPIVPTVGKVYYVQYVDQNYPCDCPCHTDGGILHIAACCSDRSFSGLAKCVEVVNPEWYIFYVPNRGWMKLHISSILEEGVIS
jgi:hypothetical protein